MTAVNLALQVALMLTLALTAASISSAQAQSQNSAPKQYAALNDPAPSAAPPATSTASTTSPPPSSANAESSSKPASSSEAEIPPAVAKQLEEMEKRIEELEAALKEKNSKDVGDSSSSSSSSSSTVDASAESSSAANTAFVATPSPQQAPPNPAAAADATPVPRNFSPQTQSTADPFSYADWTWLNGNPRTEDTPLATKYFTPEVRFDTNYTEDYNQPRDHSLGGSTETFRSGEVVLEQASFGGDIHVDNVRGRILTMFGMFASTTPRNDGSAGVGQWDYNTAYRYVSEAWGGYHFNVNHGLNIDAGIFVSYIGLFSYYNFDNWTYQPSYVSSNTPWFFNGVRIQWFPTEKLKIEPWFINGWQSYAKYNGHPGLGGQILWRPHPWLSMVFNNYGMGTDTLGVPGRSRIHTDNSIEVRYYNQPENLGLDKMAFSATGDLGCEYGGSAPGNIVSCHNNSNGHPKQDFAGWMLYNRFWFHKDLFGLTLGGGRLDNPGRYLTLLPPINGASAVSGSPYFPSYPGSIYKAWDSTVTLDYMPTQFITFRAEAGYRYANVPYWTGRQGITPPGGNVGPVALDGSIGTGASYLCTNGSTSMVAPQDNQSNGTPYFTYSGEGLPVDNASGGVSQSCASLSSAVLSPSTAAQGPWSLWQPDLRKSQWVNTIAIMVKW